MFRPRKIILTNFMGHEQSEFVFREDSAVEVYGVNNYDEGATSNGSGKSSILEAISVGFINASLRKGASAKDLVRRGSKSAFIEIELENTTLNINPLIIRRTIYSGSKSGELYIELSGEEKKFTSVKEGDAFLLELLGIPREDLLNYFLISKEKYKPFFQMSDTDKKKVIGRFAQVDILNPVEESIKEDVSDSEDKIRNLEVKVGNLQSKIETLEDLIYNEGELKAPDYSDEINRLSGLIENTKVKTALPEPTKPSFDNSKLKEELTKYREKDSKIEKALLSSITCPKCSNEFSTIEEWKEIDMEKVKSGKPKVKSRIKEIEQELKRIRDKESEYDKDLREYRKSVREAQKQKDDIKAWQHKISKLKELGNITPESKIPQYESKIKVHNKEISEIRTKIKEEEENKLKYLSGREILLKFRTHLVNQAIGALEYKANEYLNKTKTNLRLRLDGYKQNRQGKIQEKITATVVRNGVDEQPYSLHSGGEKVKIDIAILMSLQSLINDLSEYGRGLDLVWLDEILESVDSLGINGIMKSLNGLEKTIVVITHGTQDSIYPNRVRVEKGKDQISRIV